MSVHLRDEQLHLLLASDPGNAKLQQEMKFRLRMNIIRKMPSPTGTCSAGLPVILDDKGAHSSGYWCHVGHGHGACFHTDPKTGAYTGDYEVVKDPDPPVTVRLKKLLASLK